MNIKNRTIEIKKGRIGDFKRNARNPKGHGVYQLDVIKELYEKFGIVGSVIVYRSERNGGEWTLFDGHGRQQLNPDTEYDVQYTNLSDKEVDELVAFYDRSASLADVDIDIQTDLLKSIDIRGSETLTQFAMDMIAEDGLDIDPSLLEGLGGISGANGDGNGDGNGEGGGKETEPPQVDKANELQAIWQVREGDIWQLEANGLKHLVLCGDCTDGTSVGALMGDELIDIVCADPPYGMNLDTDYTKMTGNGRVGKRYDAVIGDDKDFDPRPLMDIFKDVKEQFWWGADYYAERIPNKNNGSWLVWDKTLSTNGDAGYNSEFELCWSKTKHKREVIHFAWFRFFGLSQQDNKTRPHPNQKPIQVIQNIIDKFSNENNVVYDPFLGSGTTLVAAHQTGRQCRGTEIEPKYVAVTLQRFKDLTGIDPVLIRNIKG
jgi:DNA modification methylase